MAKFTVLQSNQRLISLVCGIDIGQKAKSTGSFFTSIPVYSLLFILSNVALSFAVKTSINSYDLMARITAASIVIAYCQAITIFLQTGLRMQQFIGLIQTFQTIVDDEAENDNNIHEVYWRTEQKYRKFVKIITTTTVVYDQFAYVLAFIYSIYCCCIGNYDISTWPMILEMSVPFDTNTIGGWYLLLFILMSMDLAYLACFFLVSTQFFGCCMYIAAICEHFHLLMQTVQANVEQNRREINQQNFGNTNLGIIATYRKAIQLHVKINEIFDNVADINSVTIFTLIAPTALVIGIFIYQMHQVNVDLAAAAFDTGGVFYFLMSLLFLLVWPFIFCYFATLAIDRISNIQRTVYNLNWYDFPPELRKYSIMIMLQSQRPICFTGFGLVRCTLTSFGILVKSSISCYLAFDVISNRV